MTIPYVVSTDPLTSEIDVAINSTISITFNTPLLESSVTGANISVVRFDNLATYEMTPVAGTLQYDPTNYTIVFLPTSNLSYDKVYQVIVSADANPSDLIPTGIRSSDGTSMITNHVFRFTTEPEETSTSEDSSTTADTGEVTRSGYLTVSITEPEILATFYRDVYTKIKFNDDLIIDDTGMTTFGTFLVSSGEVLNNYVIVYRQALLGSDSNHYITPLDPVEYDWDLDDDILTLYLVDTGTYTQLPYNSKYIVTVNPGMSGVNTYAMQTLYQYSFTTEIAPLYTTPQRIRANAGILFNQYTDSWIYTVIHKYSERIYNIFAEANAAGTTNITLPALPTDSGTVPEFVQQYVLCNAKLDLLRQVSNAQAIGAGTITLGDFSMKAGDISDMIGSELNALENCVANVEIYINNLLYPRVKAMVPHLYDGRAPWYNTDGTNKYYRHVLDRGDD